MLGNALVAHVGCDDLLEDDASLQNGNSNDGCYIAPRVNRRPVVSWQATIQDKIMLLLDENLSLDLQQNLEK